MNFVNRNDSNMGHGVCDVENESLLVLNPIIGLFDEECVTLNESIEPINKNNSNMLHRVCDVENESLLVLNPIIGLFDKECGTLNESIEPIKCFVEDLDMFTWLSYEFSDSFDFNKEFVSAINLYTREFNGKSLYDVLNEKLRSEKRDSLIPFFPYLRLLITSLLNLPNDKHFTGSLWRGVKKNLSTKYKKGKKCFWWGFSSCTTQLSVLQNEMFLGNTGDRTLFHIHCKVGYNIMDYSSLPKESEVILLPGRYFQVVDILDQGDLHIIELDELTPPFQIIKGIDSVKVTPIIIQPTLLPLSIPGKSEYDKAEILISISKYKESLPLLKISSDKEYPPSFVMLGWLYNHGGYVGQKDETKSVYWWGLASKFSEWFRIAQTGETQPDIQFCLGFYFRWVKSDFKEAVKYYKLSADQGHAFGQNNLGCCYENGEGVEKDYKEAVKYYKLSADQGNALGQFNLGRCYENGEGVEKDYKEAVKYYKLSADQGNAFGQNNLGWCYEHGKDYKEAVKYFKLSADQGNALGQYNLGCCYKNGQGVEKDYNEAVKYFKLSADQGNELALSALKRPGVKHFFYSIF